LRPFRDLRNARAVISSQREDLDRSIEDARTIAVANPEV